MTEREMLSYLLSTGLYEKGTKNILIWIYFTSNE